MDYNEMYYKSLKIVELLMFGKRQYQVHFDSSNVVYVDYYNTLEDAYKAIDNYMEREFNNPLKQGV